jgi:hypothetical protein
MYLPYHYQTPKWLAKIKPDYKVFWCADGTVIRSLLELKHALMVLPEEILAQHVSDKHNHLADWVDGAVWDHHLARLLRSNPQRWEMIVNLERHQMRTLNLPPYLAARWLSPVEEPFYLADGRYISSLVDLKHALMEVEEAVFDRHMNCVPNDFSNWVDGSIGDYQLAEILTESDKQKKLVIKLSDHLEMLHEAAKEY